MTSKIAQAYIMFDKERSEWTREEKRICDQSIQHDEGTVMAQHSNVLIHEE